MCDVPTEIRGDSDSVVFRKKSFFFQETNLNATYRRMLTLNNQTADILAKLS